MMATREPALCKRCLLRELTDGAYFQSIYEYIESLAPDLRAPDTLYGERLARCKACGHLINGMCDLCGCFVEVRAAKKAAHCAQSSAVW